MEILKEAVQNVESIFSESVSTESVAIQWVQKLILVSSSNVINDYWIRVFLLIVHEND